MYLIMQVEQKDAELNRLRDQLRTEEEELNRMQNRFVELQVMGGALDDEESIQSDEARGDPVEQSVSEILYILLEPVVKR